MPKHARTTRRLEVWLKDTDLPLFVLNAQRRLVFFNHGCERLTGWTAADVMGQVCDYLTEPDAQAPAALLAALAPPPEAWLGRPVDAPAHLPRRAADPLPRVIHFYPLPDDDQFVNALLGIIVPAPDSANDERAPGSQRLHAELAALRQSIRRRFGEGTLIGRSASIRRVFDQVKLAQPSSASVLFVGETGAGKQHLARVLHYQSPLGKQAFVPLDCRRAATEDLEATLARLRDDQQADALRAGAVYFDFIDAAPADFQSRLIEWLATNTGLDFARVLAGSTRSLEPLVEAETFSRELYFALTTLVIEVAPLRDRREDLEPLAQYFLEELNRSAPQQVGGLTDDVWRQFRRYHWPGNVAELRAVIEEAWAACSVPLIGAEHLPFRFKAGVGAQSVGPSIRPRPEPLDPLLERIEREQIELALAESRQNKARAAELLGITRPRLYRRMEALGIIDLEPKPDATEPTIEDDAPA
ncbi:MAG: sigma 54-interacting transcriptional regulator [Planctomycetota bacterium]